MKRRVQVFLLSAKVAMGALLVYGCNVMAQAPVVTVNQPGRQVTVVLAGGGAKGFAHLAVLRRLERDNVKISKIVGTSIGSVIGGLYASGLSIDDIQTVVKNLDPGKVALDLLDRTELPHRKRAYQQNYPFNFEFGIQDGQFNFQRGLSDGQRFLSLMQELTAHIPTNASFDKLPIPFRAVATRYRDGNVTAFNQGSLPLAIRASMAVPGVFAPVEIDGETYVDGGLVANLAVEVALKEGADIIVASYLGDDQAEKTQPDMDNALSVANQMVNILMHQNELRNMALLRPQDILVRPQLQAPGLGSGSFDNAQAIALQGVKAVEEQDGKFRSLRAIAQQNNAQRTSAVMANNKEKPSSAKTVAKPQTSETTQTQSTETIAKIIVTGNKNVPTEYIAKSFNPLLEQKYQPAAVAQLVEDLYAKGDFERISYQILPSPETGNEAVTLAVDVSERPYGTNIFTPTFGFFSDSHGNTMFDVGLGYRKPWMNDSGLELGLDLLAGSQQTLGVNLYQPFGNGWGLSGYTSYNSTGIPLYRPDVSYAQKIATSTFKRKTLGLDLSYDFGKQLTAKIGVSRNENKITIDTAKSVSFSGDNGAVVNYDLQNVAQKFTALSAQLTADQLDSAVFPTRGYFFDLKTASFNQQNTRLTNYKLSAKWATHVGPHILNLGVNVAENRSVQCDNCNQQNIASPLVLGGFQNMGAYQFGQLIGDKLQHLQATYMYRLKDGGLLHQPIYLGFVAEMGDAWQHTQSMKRKTSGTMFLGIDSKLGTIYLGYAAGSGNNSNLFVQLGRRPN